MRVSVSVNSISKLNPNDINKALKRAVDFVALDIVKDAKNYAPSDTGNLRIYEGSTFNFSVIIF